MTRLGPRARRDEEGAVLILVMIFVFVLSIAVGAIADYAGTDFRGTRSARTVRTVNYSLDAGVTGAMNQIRYDFSQGRAPGFTGGQNLCSNYNAPTTDNQVVTVTCQGEQGVPGQADSGSVTAENNPYNRPPLAVMTDGPTSEPGITLNANGVFRIHGQVASTSSIDVANATLKVEGDVNAVGPCTGQIISLAPPYTAANNYGTPQAVNCPTTSIPAMPAYDPLISSLPAAQSVPPCPSGWLIRFSPGLYQDAKALSQLTSGGCQGKVLWFQPGVYVFKFTNNQGGHAWTLNDATSNIVGGTPYGWSPGSAVRPVIPRADQNNPTLHSCVMDTDAVPAGADPANLGVQFIFAGDSRLAVGNVSGNGNEGGNFEICAPRSQSGQEIALYGVPATGGNATTFAAAASTGSNAAGSPAFANPGNAARIDTILSSVTLAKNQTAAKLTVGGFAPLDSSVLPDSASVTSVILKIAHSESGNGMSDVLNLTAADGAAFPSVATLSSCSPLCTTNVDVTRYLGSVSRLRSGSGAVSIGYTASTGNQAGTASVDGMELDVTWVPKSLTPTTATSSGSPAFASPSNALTIDSTTSTATVVGNGQTATVSFAGFNQMDATDLPPGAQIVSVVARIVHRESAAVSQFTISGQTATGVNYSRTVPASTMACVGSSLCRDNVDLTSSFPNDAALRTIVTNGNGTVTITGPTLSYAVTGSGTGSNKITSNAELDGVRLDVTYLPSPLGAESGCILQIPYDPTGNNGSCAILQAVGNHAYIAIHGTVYAPSAVMDAKVMNGGTTVFGRGAFVRSLRLFFNPSVTYSDQNIYFTVNDPDPSILSVHDRVVDFWACLGRVTTCSDATAPMHAVAEYADTSTVGASVTVKQWARRR